MGRKAAITRAQAKPVVERTLYVLMLFMLLLGVFGVALLLPWAASTLPGINPSEPPKKLLSDSIQVTTVGAACTLMLLFPSGPGKPTLKGFLASTFRRFRQALARLGSALGVRRYSAGELGRLVLVSVALTAGMTLLNQWLIGLPLGPGWAPSPDDPRTITLENAAIPVQVLYSLINAPVIEELLFRGPLLITAFLLTTSVARRDITPVWQKVILGGTTVVLTVLFAAAHAFANGSNVTIAGAAGIALAWLALRYKSLLPGIVMHALYNGLSTLI